MRSTALRFALVLVPILAAAASDAAAASAPRAWASDAVWYDGRAEKCVYEATRTIYGEPRSYVAIAYTNKEKADPETTCKSEDDTGIEVFKHHWSERVPTPSYDYDFSTLTYTRTADLAAWKLTAATQEDCGASFKEVWRDGDRLRFFESVYFPGTGRREGVIAQSAGAALADALTLTLRDYDFDARPVVTLSVVPSQKDTQQVSYEPVERRVRYVGRETITLPIGQVDAHELALETAAGTREARYWFAADGSAPSLHALVRYEGPHGVTYRLASQERSAYWER